MFELLGLSVVAGVILGVGWRLVENWQEKRHQPKINEEVKMGGTTEQTVMQDNPTNKSN